jgi:TM2 domain-containing membrane protein YozV
MFCRNCGKELMGCPEVCVGCGARPLAGRNYCQSCGAETNALAVVCLKCGAGLTPDMSGEAVKSKLVAGLLGILLGGWGVHRFYLGYTGIGILQIVVTIVTCGIGAWWGIIEGIMILTGSIDKDAQGRPLKET